MHRELKKLAGAPALLVGQGHPYRGTVLVYHGLGSNKEALEKELVLLARRGFLAVGVDGFGHGERFEPDCQARLQGDDWHLEFLKMVRRTADEVPEVVRALHSLSDGLGRIGLTGISMGGCVAFAAAANQGCLSAVAPVLGSPDWSLGGRHQLPDEWWRDSPHLTPEWFNPTPLLIQNAGRDRHVPCAPSRAFAAEASRYYHQTPENLRYFEYPDSDHFMLAQDWELLWERVMAWFERFLS